ncbi:MAG: transcriptional repressor [Pseudomonadota bacterium]
MNSGGAVNAAIDIAERQCREQGARLTDKRKRILAGLLRSGTALSAYELVDYFKAEHGESIPPMSVYRILDFLQSQQLVHKLNLTNKYVACAHIGCSSDHEVSQFLICGNCQRVDEISIPKAAMDSLRSSVESAGFHLVDPQIEINCVCQNCLESDD